MAGFGRSSSRRARSRLFRLKTAMAIKNIAPFSSYAALSNYPPLIGLSFGLRGPTGSEKRTLANIRENGEFVVNLGPALSWRRS